MAGFGISGVEPSSSTARELIGSSVSYVSWLRPGLLQLLLLYPPYYSDVLFRSRSLHSQTVATVVRSRAAWTRHCMVWWPATWE